MWYVRQAESSCSGGRGSTCRGAAWIVRANQPSWWIARLPATSKYRVVQHSLAVASSDVHARLTLAIVFCFTPLTTSGTGRPIT